MRLAPQLLLNYCLSLEGERDRDRDRETKNMKLKRFLIRYYPPGIILEYASRDGTTGTKEIPLLHLTAETDVEVLVNQIVFEQPLIKPTRMYSEILLLLLRINRLTRLHTLISGAKKVNRNYDD